MKYVAITLALVACGHHDVVEPTTTQPLPSHEERTLDGGSHQRRRMLPPEAFLRAYLAWFGGLGPIEVQKRAHGFDLFDQWTDYIAALGLPDYKLDVPRVTQSNAMMLATMGRLAEALCVRAAEHDLRHAPARDQQVVFRFDARPSPSLEDFTPGFDVLHRMFLSYPAPRDRTARFYALYQDVAQRHHTADKHKPLDADETAWAAVCTALITHPEAGLY